ncbi:hypothetical protein ACM55I_13800 [Flavobacterium sp. GB2R13]|uniref:hypothetical protein n=1 Tax=Flavobacterium algoris TaxID=3398733 RepID=UPI003A896499
MTWITSCNLKGWEGQTARDYYVFATPALYLLNVDNKIRVKPISPGTNYCLAGHVKKERIKVGKVMIKSEMGVRV